jgi:hypothetical protein
MREDPKNIKMIDSLTAFFVHLGSFRTKASPKMLMKLTTGADAIKKFTPSLGIPYLGV